MTVQNANQVEANDELKERVRAFWQTHPCGTKFSDAEIGTREFFASLEAHRYRKEWHIPIAANFAATRGLKVLEIGCGIGTDGAQFAKAGADYTGIDLTAAAIELARKRFALSNLKGEFRVSDAEDLDFDNESFDLVYSHGVLHHTPDIEAALREIHRVLKPGGRAIVMLYHRGSYNYRIGIRVLRRAGAGLLKSESGIKLVHRLTGEYIANEIYLIGHASMGDAGDTAPRGATPSQAPAADSPSLPPGIVAPLIQPSPDATHPVVPPALPGAQLPPAWYWYDQQSQQLHHRYRHTERNKEGDDSEGLDRWAEQDVPDVHLIQ